MTNDPAMNLPMAKAAELMGAHMAVADATLVVTAPYCKSLPQEFINACHIWGGEHGSAIKFIDAATGKRVTLRMRG